MKALITCTMIGLFASSTALAKNTQNTPTQGTQITPAQSHQIKACINQEVRNIVGKPYAGSSLSNLLSQLKAKDRDRLMDNRSKIMNKCYPKQPNDTAMSVGSTQYSGNGGAQCCGGNWEWIFGICTGTLYYYPDFCQGGTTVCNPENQCHQ